MNPQQHEEEMDWEATTWEGSRRRRIEHWASLSLDDIFAAQEDMAEFARKMGALGDEDDVRARPPRGEC